MTVEENLMQFKMMLRWNMPFYGDVLTKLVFLEDNHVPTAATDGLHVFYNKEFMGRLPNGEQNFIWMHEVFHVILLHAFREGKRDHEMWNIATDLVINNMLTQMTRQMRSADIPFDVARGGVFSDSVANQTAEDIYENLMANNSSGKAHKKVVFIQKDYRGNETARQIELPNNYGDIIVGNETIPTEMEEACAEQIKQFVRDAMKGEQKSRSSFGSYAGKSFLPPEIYELSKPPTINWKVLLKNYLTETQSEETSYATPERKYLHMDLILPGHGESEQELESVWAFVDCSGSIGGPEMQNFIKQLYHITKDFGCIMNIVYWDTQVQDIYKDISKPEDVIKALPKHSGGTDINCVYRWIRDNKLKPDVMLILTDGYFGMLNQSDFVPTLKKNTILVLSSAYRTSDMDMIGRIAEL